MEAHGRLIDAVRIGWQLRRIGHGFDCSRVRRVGNRETDRRCGSARAARGRDSPTSQAGLT